ncbi:MAG TPA: arginine--tRNA ligase, partial [Acidimicrobiales bacterium]|nr:arginine--tRNA ligase [Acidimicrobiales bacterium]
MTLPITELTGTPKPITDSLVEAIYQAMAASGLEIDRSEIRLERSSRIEHGEFSTNIAMVVAKKVGKPPRQLASELADRLEAGSVPHVLKVEVAGPGFINFDLQPSWLAESLARLIELGERSYARVDLGAGERVQIEFVSANPTGPLHVGNGWLCSYGDTLARLMEFCGWQVSREYYVNDTGGQIRKLGMSLLARVAGEEVPEEGYQGDYVKQLAKRYPDLANSDVLAAGRWAANEILANIKASMNRLGIEFDEWYSQASVEEGGAVKETIDFLSARGLVYESEGATWLRSSDLGDSRDRVLIKSNGDVTYLGGDIAYHRNKFLIRGFDRVVDVFGADHHGQVASLKAAIRALGVEEDRLEIQLGQMVSLADGKMSKRAGNFVSLDELLDDIGPDAFRLLSLTKSINESTTLDLELVRRQTNENPVYYVQYAYARIASIDRVRADKGIDRQPIDRVDLKLLSHERELAL